MAAEVDVDRGLRAANLPGIAVAQPVVGELDLPAVADGLLEDAELVADAVADGGNAERGHGVEIAGRETAEAAVAEAGFALLLDDLVEVETEFGACLADGRFEAEVEQVVEQVRPHQELGGEIADHAHIVPGVALEGLDPAGEDAVAHGVGDGGEVVVLGGVLRGLGDDVVEIVEDGALESLDAVSGAVVFDGHGWFGGLHFHWCLVDEPERGLKLLSKDGYVTVR